MTHILKIFRGERIKNITSYIRGDGGDLVKSVLYRSLVVFLLFHSFRRSKEQWVYLIYIQVSSRYRVPTFTRLHCFFMFIVPSQVISPSVLYDGKGELYIYPRPGHYPCSYTESTVDFTYQREYSPKTESWTLYYKKLYRFIKI